MPYIKYFVCPWFKRAEFAALLNAHGVKAAAEEDGVILNLKEFNSIPSGQLPTWAFLNKPDINSQFHTRPATVYEYLAAAH